MDLTIKQTTINTVETATTSLAQYELNVTRVNGDISKVTVAVIQQKTSTDNSGIPIVSAQSVGNIIYQNGAISLSSMPADNHLPQFLAETLEIIKAIKERDA